MSPISPHNFISLVVIFWPTLIQCLFYNASQQRHISLAKCAIFVSQRYIFIHTRTILLMENCENCSSLQRDYNLQLMDFFLKNTDTNITLQHGSSDEYTENWNVFIVNNARAFTELSFYYPITLYERKFYFLIILTLVSASLDQLRLVMSQIFTLCMSFKVVHAVIMFEQPDGIIEFFTYRLYRPNCVKGLYLTRINRYHNGRLDHDYLFPIRLRNFFGCSINITAYILPPHLSFDGDRKNPQHVREMYRLSGIEGDILKILAQTLNFSMSLTLHVKKSTIANKTGYFGELAAGTADIAIGALSGSDPLRNNFTISAPYHYTPFVFIIRSQLNFGPLRQLIHTFSFEVWLVIGCTILTALLMIKVLNSYVPAQFRYLFMGAHNTSPNINLLTIFLGYPVTYLPRRNFARFLLVSWLLITMVLRNAYQCKMFDSLRVSVNTKQPKDLNELIAEDYTLITTLYWDFYPRNRSILVEENFQERFVMVDKTDGKYVSLALLDGLAHYNRINSDTSTLTYVKEPIYLYQQVLYFGKHSVYKYPFDHKLKQLMGAGITAQIARKHVKMEYVSLNVGSHLLPKISNNMLRGLYTIYGALMGLAFVCFVLELVSLRSKRCQRLMIWLH